MIGVGEGVGGVLQALGFNPLKEAAPCGGHGLTAEDSQLPGMSGMSGPGKNLSLGDAGECQGEMLSCLALPWVSMDSCSWGQDAGLAWWNCNTIRASLLSRTGLTFGLSDLRGLFQPQSFCDSDSQLQHWTCPSRGMTHFG